LSHLGTRAFYKVLKSEEEVDISGIKESEIENHSLKIMSDFLLYSAKNIVKTDSLPHKHITKFI